ncbi:dodecin [Novipirellula sp. SH528]|uniref:dodecin n=1 Tax=Novipirellula sp. SH528 TaxID=3454466 RepID=UPI003FA06FF1
MPHHTYKKIEIVGTSTVSMEDAVNNAVAQASGSVRGLSWFEVVETRGTIAEGKVSHWQVTVKIGFTID